MKFEPRVIPEGINTSGENPLKEFFILIGGALLIILGIILIAFYASDYLIKYIPIETEQSWFSSENFSDPLTDEHPSTDQKTLEVENYLQDLVDKLQDESYSNFSFKVKIMDEDTANAFITPGGNIFITTGLLKTINSENALAMVLGHEIGHQYHRHPIRSAGRGIIILLALIALGGFEDSAFAQSLIADSVTMVSMAFSREQEREADATGVKLLVNHYGHAQGAAEFFREVEKLEHRHSTYPVFFSTHPGTQERIDFLNAYENATTGRIIPLPNFITEYTHH